MIDDVDHEPLKAAIARHQREDGTVNYTDLGAEIGLHRSNAKRRVALLSASGALGTKPVLPGFSITKITSKDEDGNHVTQKPASNDLQDKIPEGHIVERTSLKIGDDWYKTKLSNSVLTRDAVEEMFSEWRGQSEILHAPRGCDPSRLALYPTADLHLGMLAWGKDSGRAWDLAIAERELMSAYSEIIQLTPSTHTAILLDLGDQFHMNDQSNATPAHKHRLDVDGRFPKVAKAATKIRRKMIEMALQHHEHVIYAAVGGNHDPEAQMWLSVGLDMFFENNPRVEVDTSPDEFWKHEFGKVFLFANHGHKIKPDRLPEIMASDYPEIWGRTEHRYAFSGHIHTLKSSEKMKCTWETLRTINPGDNFAHTGGWRSGHELTSITYSEETGQRHRQYVPV